MFYKTWLFVPAREKYLNKNIHADVVIYDLEDSIKTDDKENARERLTEKLSQGQHNKVFIRINSGAVGTQDLSYLKNSRYDGVLIPKFEDPRVLEDYKEYLQEKEVVALIESGAGIVKLEKILSTEEIKGVAFGGEDYCKELSVETNDSAMQYARGRIILLSRFFKKYCLDTISLEYRDAERFTNTFMQSIQMGFDSKMLSAMLENIVFL